jgi:hypothetical protein
MNERRTWNTPAREPWNPVIYQMLRAIDHHNEAFFRDGNDWHIDKAIILRQYVRELKDWLNEEETNTMAGLVSCSGAESRNE